jgi:hypothetical protein
MLTYCNWNGSAYHKMAAFDLSKSHHETSNLMGLAIRAAEDLHSQAGRVGDNISLVRNFGHTILANGVIDDRKFLVRTTLNTSRRIW